MDFWTKLKIWTKLTIFGLLALFALIFAYKNDNQTATVWFIHDYQTSVLRLLFFTFLFGMLTTLLLRMTYRTIRQIVDMRRRGRTQKLEKEIQEMKGKIEQQQKAEPHQGPP